MKHTIKLLTLAFTLAAILTLTGCPGPVNTVVPCTHENKKTVIETAATCTETGLEKIICADCEEVLEEQKLPIDPENHDWELKSDTATCTEDGVKTYKCSRCDETKTENIPAHHTFIAGGCDKCGAYEHNKEDDYQISLSIYSSEEDTKPIKTLYFSFEKDSLSDYSEIKIDNEGAIWVELSSLLQMKPEYYKCEVKKIQTNVLGWFEYEDNFWIGLTNSKDNFKIIINNQ